MYIYKTTCLVNGKVYIGQCLRQVEKSIGYLGSGTKLVEAMKKYGREQFVKEILRTCEDRKELNIWERLYIMKFRSYAEEIGYNILKGAALEYENPMHIPEVVEKLRGEGNSFFGKKHTVEVIEFLRQVNKENKRGLHFKTGEANPMYNRKGDKHPLYGSKFKWINDGKKNYRLNAQEELPEGYYPGKIQKYASNSEKITGRNWYTNGTRDIMVFESEVPEGFVKGRTNGKFDIGGFQRNRKQ